MRTRSTTMSFKMVQFRWMYSIVLNLIIGRHAMFYRGVHLKCMHTWSVNGLNTISNQMHLWHWIYIYFETCLYLRAERTVFSLSSSVSFHFPFSWTAAWSCTIVSIKYEVHDAVLLHNNICGQYWDMSLELKSICRLVYCITYHIWATKCSRYFKPEFIAKCNATHWINIGVICA